MRCASLHRKLGTHISKVKSLSMDTWTDDQVDVSCDSDPGYISEPENEGADRWYCLEYEIARKQHHEQDLQPQERQAACSDRR